MPTEPKPLVLKAKDTWPRSAEVCCEAPVKIAKRELVPTEANLDEEYAGYATLVGAWEELCDRVNARVHRETGRAPIDMLAEERAHLHLVPVEAHTAALGQTRRVQDDQTIR